MSGVDVCLAGNGAREHALAWALRKSPLVGRIGASFANGGMIRDGVESIPLKVRKPEDVDPFLREMERLKFEFLIASTDDSVACGVTDEARKRGFRVFGPTAAAGRIEWDKAYAKEVMRDVGIPTPTWKQFKADQDAEALAYLRAHEIPVIVKAPRLALGKGVRPCMHLAEAEQALKSIMIDKVYGEENADAIIESYVPGPEVSATAVTKCLKEGPRPKVQLRWFPFTRDYKKAFDKDQGPNTGGMGAYGPVLELNPREKRFVYRMIGRQFVKRLAAMGVPYNGALYPGLVLTRPTQTYEYNARFGDPETQVLMRLLRSDLFRIFDSVAQPNMRIPAFRLRKGYAVCVVLASEGYGHMDAFPQVRISGLEHAEQVDNVVIFHAGTELRKDGFYAVGGRVLSVTAWGRTLEEAHDQAYYAVHFISFKGMQHRTDIALIP